MSDFASVPRPYQQEPTFQARNRPRDTMTSHRTPQIVAAIAAVATTVVLFNSVAKLADSDQSVLLAARIAPTSVAAAH